MENSIDLGPAFRHAVESVRRMQEDFDSKLQQQEKRFQQACEKKEQEFQEALKRERAYAETLQVELQRSKRERLIISDQIKRLVFSSTPLVYALKDIAESALSEDLSILAKQKAKEEEPPTIQVCDPETPQKEQEPVSSSSSSSSSLPPCPVVESEQQSPLVKCALALAKFKSSPQEISDDEDDDDDDPIFYIPKYRLGRLTVRENGENVRRTSRRPIPITKLSPKFEGKVY